MATEVGMLHPLQMAAPDVDFVAANEAASCRYMKMITLPKLRDALRDGEPVVKVPADDRRARAGADRADGRDRAVALSAARRRRTSPALEDADRARRGVRVRVDAPRVDVAGRRARVDAVDLVGHDQLDVAGADVGVERRRRACAARG